MIKSKNGHENKRKRCFLVWFVCFVFECHRQIMICSQSIGALLKYSSGLHHIYLMLWIYMVRSFWSIFIASDRSEVLLHPPSLEIATLHFYRLKIACSACAQQVRMSLSNPSGAWVRAAMTLLSIYFSSLLSGSAHQCHLGAENAAMRINHQPERTDHKALSPDDERTAILWLLFHIFTWVGGILQCNVAFCPFADHCCCVSPWEMKTTPHLLAGLKTMSSCPSHTGILVNQVSKPISSKLHPPGPPEFF